MGRVGVAGLLSTGGKPREGGVAGMEFEEVGIGAGCYDPGGGGGGGVDGCCVVKGSDLGVWGCIGSITFRRARGSFGGLVRGWSGVMTYGIGWGWGGDCVRCDFGDAFLVGGLGI